MKQRKKSTVLSAVVSLSLLFGVAHTINAAATRSESTVEIPANQADLLVRALEYILETKAPRDGVDASDPASPISPFDSSELAAIKECLCLLKDRIGSPLDAGSCFDIIVTEEDIDEAELNLFEWMKTLMREFRGVCPCDEPEIIV